MVDELDFDLEDMLYISAKEGKGVEKVFEAIIERVEPPKAPTHDANDMETVETGGEPAEIVAKTEQ